MRFQLFCCIVALSAMAYAKEPRPYQTGKVLEMDSVQCGTDEKDQAFAGEMGGTDSSHKKTHELLCREYLLQSDNVIFRIRPRDEKRPVLLPVGDRAQFRLEKDEMFLRLEGVDSKECKYGVISMMPRTESNTADAASHVNHLQ